MNVERIHSSTRRTHGDAPVKLAVSTHENKTPPEAELNRRAAKLVDDAHRIARERGRNVLSIMKELVEDVKKKSS